MAHHAAEPNILHAEVDELYTTHYWISPSQAPDEFFLSSDCLFFSLSLPPKERGQGFGRFLLTSSCPDAI